MAASQRWSHIQLRISRRRSPLLRVALAAAVALVCVACLPTKLKSSEAFSYQAAFHRRGLRAHPGVEGNRQHSSNLEWLGASKSLLLGAKLALKSTESEPGADGAIAATIGIAKNAFIWGVGVVSGLVGLLYMTRFFEQLMHGSTFALKGKSLLVAAMTGLIVGALHTLAGPDHFAGLAPLVIGQRRTPLAAFGLGALWGSGHATGQLLLGLVCLAVYFGLVDISSAPWLDQASGCLVGASLIAIGMLGLYEARQFDQSELTTTGGTSAPKPRFGWTTYATGILHGLSPDAVVFLAPAFALSRVAAAFHVTGVVLGTLLSMGACTALLGALCHRLPNLGRVSGAASSVSILLGISILAASLGFSVPLPGL